ncbi:MAG: EF2563 family selenium-dependent molybdenum hydroxylase system protein [bacterium]|nr:EF2563 family selenium-dependent molybdenum hydroxylase system protein [bacterium]
MTTRTKVLIKGAGEHASGTAHRLFRCGFCVVMTDVEHPTAVRRTVSFSSAISQQEIAVEGVVGVGYTLDSADSLGAFDWGHIPVFVDPESQLVKLWKPDVLIDGRILKRNLDNSMHDAPLVIGYGPGLVAGRDVHCVVETNRGHDLGRVITEGAAAPDTGVPGAIGGLTAERVLRAPAGGTLRTEKDIGDRVEAGDRVGVVHAESRSIPPEQNEPRRHSQPTRPLYAAASGIIRGLLLSGSLVVAGQKVGDIDPRGVRSFCFTLSDKTRTISGAALEIIISSLNQRQTT